MEYIALSDICDVRDGTHDSPKYVDNGYPLVTSKNIVDGKLDLSAVSYLTQEDYDKINERSKVDEGDIIMPMIGTIGNPLLIEDFCEFAIKNVALIKFPNKEISNKYIWYFLKSSAFKKYVAEKNKGGTQKFLSLGDIRNMKVPNIRYSEQITVVEKLDAVYKVLEQRTKELFLLDELIKARFVEMFGDPVSNPMKWPVNKLKDLSVQINSGNTPKGGSENYVEEGITFFRSQNVWKDRLEMDDIAYIDAETHANMKKSSLKHGDILMTKTGRINTENSSLGRAALYNGEDDMANVNGHVYFIRLKKTANNKFVLRILVSPEYRDLIRSVCVGGIDKRQLNKEHIEEFPIICPPTDMVDDYVAFVEQINKLKVATQKALDEAQLLFDSLMQEYFG